MAEERSITQYSDLIEKKTGEYSCMKKCTRCMLPEKFRWTGLSESGNGDQCAYCDDYDMLSDDVEQRSETQLIEVIDKYKKKGGKYDAAVCFSGGKDSTFLLNLFKEKYGLNVVAFTFDTLFLSDIAKQNIETAVEKLGVDHKWTVGKPEIKELYRHGFTKNSQLGVEADVCYLCEEYMRTNLVELAIREDVPLIVNGFDHFQLIDGEFVYRSYPLIDKHSCWPEFVREKGMFEDMYTINNFDSKKKPVELYPFFYMPYDADKITQQVNKLGIVKDTNPIATNCKFSFLIDVVDLLRNGYPAYVHTRSADLMLGRITHGDAFHDIQLAVEEFKSGKWDAQIFEALDSIDLTMDEVLNAPKTVRNE